MVLKTPKWIRLDQIRLNQIGIPTTTTTTGGGATSQLCPFTSIQTAGRQSVAGRSGCSLTFRGSAAGLLRWLFSFLPVFIFPAQQTNVMFLHAFVQRMFAAPAALARVQTSDQLEDLRTIQSCNNTTQLYALVEPFVSNMHRCIFATFSLFSGVQIQLRPYFVPSFPANGI